MKRRKGTYWVTPNARDGYLHILEYVAEKFGPKVCEQVRSRIDAALERIAASPRLGRRRPDIVSNPEVRFWSVRPSLIGYRIREGHVEILMIERGERDLAMLLGRRRSSS